MEFGSPDFTLRCGASGKWLRLIKSIKNDREFHDRQLIHYLYNFIR